MRKISMKLTMILFIIIFSFGCDIKSNVYSGEYYENDGKYYYVSNNKLITGVILKHHPSGGLHYELELKNGFKDGKEVHYFTTGNIIDLKEYKKGVLNGRSIEAHILSQRIIEKGYYLNGKKSGKWELYYDNGKLKEKITYKKNKVVKSTKFNMNGDIIN